ncbi:MAG TPA: SDR family NAD(P)-dependent oxidoreductase [Acidobacteriaceae bacterium]|jgi:acyl transferase domain-containing protein|nr:SDR family NAD(P)-dependent oxidoreductase [Acidobacteriaceae bacterium]
MSRNRELAAVALTGMAGRFPGADTVREFWRNLVEGRESVRLVAEEELQAAGVDPSLIAHPDYVPAASQMKDPEFFDAAFFGFSAREAEIIDPQQRVFLECAWSALEDAGCDPSAFPGAIAVFAGAGMNSYAPVNLMSHPELLASVGWYQAMVSNDKDFLCSRVAYKLNLRGPAVGVQTACSTSLVAVQMAFESLLRGECDMALAGGVSIPMPQVPGYVYTPGMIFSRDGHCRAFDADASGTVPGAGAGVVVLRRLDDALADGDPIYAVLRGAAVNNDGAAKVGYSAPSVEGQERVIRRSMEMAGFDPASVRYVEAHGTGTEVGDPIEVTALARAFGSISNGDIRCALGALKTNLGHLDAAAGVAGLMKTALALRHRAIPPTLHFKRPNPLLELEKTHFYVNTAVEKYDGNEPLRAGVSSFGIGGTNAHVSLEEPPARVSGDSRQSELLVLSAKTPGALDARMAQLLEFLDRTPEAKTADVAFTLAVGRQAFRCRQALVARDLPQLQELLRSGASAPEMRKLRNDETPADPANVAFLFPGQGAQYVHMGRDLYDSMPLFRETVDRCSAALEPALGFDLRTVLYPRPGEEEQAEQRLRQTSITQPALFTIEYATAQLWMQCGITPAAMIGHSIGEYVAACLAGVFSLEDALALVAERGRLMQSLPGGVMLAVSLSEFNLTPLLPAGVSIAAINAENQTVASGAEADIAQLEAALQKKGVRFTRLRSSHAFHSPMVDPVVDSFVERVAKTQRKEPALPWLSNVSGTWITAEEATDPAYWGSHLRRTVRFADCARVLLQETEALLLEVGPGETLSSLIRAQSGTKRPVISSMRHALAAENDREHWLAALGQLWMRNVTVQWKAVYAGQRRLRVSLPTYPFERQRYYVEPAKLSSAAAATAAETRQDPADWFYVPSWKRIPSVPNRSDDDGVTLVFADDSERAAAVVAGLRATGRVLAIRSGAGLRSVSTDTWEMEFGRADDYPALMQELLARELWPRRILVMPDTEGIEGSLARALFLVKAVGDSQRTDPIAFTIAVDRAWSVVGEEISSPDGGALAAFWRVVPVELPHCTVRIADVEIGRPDAAAQVVAEVRRPGANETVACRGTMRWQPIYEPFPLTKREENSPGALSLRQNGTYLITGGTGGIGLVLARHIAQRTQGLLVLTSRTPVPPQEEWDARLASPATAPELKRKIEGLRSIRDAGGRVLTLQADATDSVAMQKILADLQQQHGAVHGIIHAAGLPGSRIIRASTPDQVRTTLAPKVQAGEWIRACLGRPQSDFVLLCSSFNAIIPVLGLADYSAANAWLDGFAAVHDNPSGTRVISVNWDRWRDVGMTANAKVPAGFEEYMKQLDRYAIRPQEATLVFDRLLTMPLPQIIVSTRDFEWRRQASSHQASSSPAMLQTETERPIAQTVRRHSAEGAQDDVEAGVIEVWEELLGVPVGPQDNFFELGGHSLVGTQVLSRIRERFGVNLDVRTVFEAVTPAELAERIRLMRWALNPDQEVVAAGQREEVEF